MSLVFVTTIGIAKFSQNGDFFFLTSATCCCQRMLRFEKVVCSHVMLMMPDMQLEGRRMEFCMEWNGKEEWMRWWTVTVVHLQGKDNFIIAN